MPCEGWIAKGGASARTACAPSPLTRRVADRKTQKSEEAQTRISKGQVAMAFKYLSIAVLTGGLMLGACAEQGYGTKQTIGGGTGAVLGGLAGAAVGKGGSSATRAAATGIGAVAGLLIGSEIGRHMEEQDRQQADRAVQQAHSAPIGQEITWNNPDSGHHGTVVPVRDGTNQSGLYCREYRQTVTVGGKVEEAYGTACQQPDGSWKLVS